MPPPTGEQQALGEDLADDSESGCTDRRADRKLRPACRPLGNQKIRDVDTCNQQDAGDSGEQDQQRLTNVTGDVLTELMKNETDVVIASRILLRELRGECVHLFLRRGPRRAIFQPDERGERVRAARRRLTRRFGHERGDNVCLGDREVERRREHSDDGVGLPVERETAPEHARIAAETRAPERCAQDDDALGSGVIVRRLDQAAQKRSGAEQRQHVAGDQDAIQPLRLCAGAVIKELRAMTSRAADAGDPLGDVNEIQVGSAGADPKQ